MLSDLRFASFLTYAPRHTGRTDPEADRARDWMYRIKNDRVFLSETGARTVTSRHLTHLLGACIARTPLGALLGPSKTLVPVPTSGLQKRGSLWVPMLLARALVDVGLGATALPCLRRVTAVPKAAFAKPGQRPDAREHYDSLAVEAHLQAPSEIVLVDDIVTRGAQLIGAAGRLQEAFPEAEIAAFAMMRTMSYGRSFMQLRDPCVGVIRLRPDGSTDRNP